MSRCKNCGQQVSPEEKICPNCGYDLQCERELKQEFAAKEAKLQEEYADMRHELQEEYAAMRRQAEKAGMKSSGVTSPTESCTYPTTASLTSFISWAFPSESVLLTIEVSTTRSTIKPTTKMAMTAVTYFANTLLNIIISVPLLTGAGKFRSRGCANAAATGYRPQRALPRCHYIQSKA